MTTIANFTVEGPVGSGTAGGNPLLVGALDGSGNTVALKAGADGGLQIDPATGSVTYSAAVIAFTPVATPTDIFNFFGSASKISRVTRLEVSGITSAATAAALDLQVIKRSTAGTPGSAVLTAVTAVPHDSSSSAATGVASTVGTANYTTLGTIVGAVRASKLPLTLSPATATDFPQMSAIVWDFGAGGTQPIVLRSASEQIGLNLNGATLPAGTALDITITWTESAT